MTKNTKPDIGPWGQQVQRILSATCDKCGQEIIDPPIIRSHDGDWVDDTHIKCSHGTYGMGTSWHVEDLCLSCSDELRDLLKANGYKVKEFTW